MAMCLDTCYGHVGAGHMHAGHLELDVPAPAPAAPIPPINEYIYISKLGKGSFGHVYLAQNIYTKELVAIKFIKKMSKVSIQDEIVNHATVCDHPNIIGFHSVFVLEDYTCLVLDYANGTDMHTMFTKKNGLMNELAASSYFIQLLSAVDHCHRHGIVHRDIKLENILMVNNTLKLCDFGYSSQVGNFDWKMIIGTPAYLAPETLLRAKAYSGVEADVWSCGVVLFVLVCGYYPFENEKDPLDIKTHINNIVKCSYTFPDYLSESCKDLFSKIFVRDHTQRITIDGIFQHPWMLIS